MEPVTVAAVAVLAKYLVDRAKDLVPGLDPRLGEALKRLSDLISGRLTIEGHKDVLTGFERQPLRKETQIALRRALDHIVASDAAFAAQVQAAMADVSQTLGNIGGSIEAYVGRSGAITGSVVGRGIVSAGGDIIGGNKRGGKES